MSKQVQFKVSIIAATISMMMAGSAFAAGNTVVGPDVNSGSGVAHVNITQIGADNMLSSDATAATPANTGAFVVHTGGGALDLTVQQVGESGGSGATGANLAAINARTSGATKIQLYQGGSAGATSPGGTGSTSGGTAQVGANREVTGNSAEITIGNSTNSAGASDVFVTQQSSSNIAKLSLGTATAGQFTGILSLVQTGETAAATDANYAKIVIDGQTTTAQTFKFGQAGPSNTLYFNAQGNQQSGATVSFGGVDFTRTTSNGGALSITGYNNAGDDRLSGANGYKYTTANGVTGSTLQGINLQDTTEFSVIGTGGHNNVQVDLLTSTASAVDVLMEGGTAIAKTNLALYGASAAINVGGTSQVSLAAGKTLAVYANAGTLAINGVTFNGNGYFSTTDGGTITMTDGTVTAASGAKVLQSGSVSNNFNATTTGSGSATWNVTQSGAAAKEFIISTSTPAADIYVSQTGALAQSATGITFAAASGSSFALVQK